MDLLKKMWIGIIGILLVLLAYHVLFPFPPATLGIRYFALAGFFLLCISLIQGPLAVLFPQKFGSLIRARKKTGVIAFIFIAIHYFLVIIYSYNFDFSLIFLNWNIFIGIPALVILFIAAITSMNKAIKVLGFSRWKLLQRGVYIAFILSLIHFIFDLNGFFIKLPSGGVFLNIAEVLLIILGFITIILQLLGFVTVKGRKAKAASENVTK